MNETISTLGLNMTPGDVALIATLGIIGIIGFTGLIVTLFYSPGFLKSASHQTWASPSGGEPPQISLDRAAQEARKAAEKVHAAQRVRYREFNALFPGHYNFRAWEEWDAVWQMEGVKWQKIWWLEFEAAVGEQEREDEKAARFILLQVKVDETDPKVLKQAWIDRLKEYHPDKHGMAQDWVKTEAAMRARKVNNAYRIITKEDQSDKVPCEA